MIWGKIAEIFHIYKHFFLQDTFTSEWDIIRSLEVVNSFWI